MNYKQATELIEQNLGPETAATLDAGTHGDKPEWGCDAQLVIDIGAAVERWVERRTKIKS